MSAAITIWFDALSRREKIMVSILLVLLAGTIAFYAIIKPFSAAMIEAELRYQEAIVRQARIESKVALFIAPDAKKTASVALVKPVTGPIETFVSQSAGEAGFAIGKIDPQTDGSVKMTIDSAEPTALFRWLTILEQRGIMTAVVSANTGQNNTLSAALELRRASQTPAIVVMR